GISHRYALAVRQCHAELMATQAWLQDEVAALRKELAAARAELHRLRATANTQRDPDTTVYGRLGSATRTFNTRSDIPSWRPISSRASGADAASARTPRLWPYEHQPGMDRGEHSVVHFQVRFVSLTFVALFIALSVIVSKD